MAVIAGEYNFSLHRSADHNVTLQFKDASDTAIDLTGWTVATQAWDRPPATKHATIQDQIDANSTQVKSR